MPVNDFVTALGALSTLAPMVDTTGNAPLPGEMRDCVCLAPGARKEYEGSMNVEIRGYRPTDHSACRDLWMEMDAAHRRLYEDASPPAADTGAGFEDYLTRLNLSGMWVAVEEETVVGVTGLMIDGRHGEVDPLIVTEAMRDSGIGTQLLERIAEEADKRQLEYLTIQPMTRNIAGLRCFHDAGYTALSQVILTKDLRKRPHEWKDGLDLQGLRFTY